MEDPVRYNESVDFYCGVTTALFSTAIACIIVHLASNAKSGEFLVPGQVMLVLSVIMCIYTFLVMQSLKKKQ